MPDPSIAPVDPVKPAETPALKPGWKTTEFWLHLLIATINSLVVSDVFLPGSQAAKFVCVVALLLQGLGYNISRAKAKKDTSSEGGFAKMDILATLAIGAVTGVAVTTLIGGCSSAQGVGRELGASAIDCATDAALDATKQFGPTVEQVLQRATSSEGSIDLPSLEDATRGFAAATGWCVVENVVAAALARLPLPGAPRSSALQAEPEELKRALGAIRASRYAGKTFKPAVGASP